MSTSKSTLDYLADCLSLVPAVTFRPMMWEYCVYSEGRIFGLVCSGILYMKTTPKTIHLYTDQVSRAYTGSKNTSPVDPDWLDDKEKLAEVIIYTLERLPIRKK